MNEEFTTVTNSGNGSSSPPASFVETWASQGELEELNGLLWHYFNLAERLTDAPNESELTDAMAAGMRAFRLLRGLNVIWSDGIHSGSIPHNWGDTRGICDRYRRWFTSSQRVLELNRRAGTQTASTTRLSDARLLYDACVAAMTPANVNVDDLKASDERVEAYNKSWDKRHTATAGGT